MKSLLTHLTKPLTKRLRKPISQPLATTLLAAVLAIASAPASAGPDKVVPYAGVIDKDGAPFSGVVNLAFALFDCPGGTCGTTPLWVSTTGTVFPPANNTPGFVVTPNDGKFSVLLGDTGMTALPATAFRASQLFVRIAVRADSGQWIALTGFQRIAPVVSAVTAEEAASFTVRQNLTVTGTSTLGALTAGTTTLGTTTVNGNATVTGNETVNGNETVVGTITAGSYTSNGSLGANAITSGNGGFTSIAGATFNSTVNVLGATTLRATSLQGTFSVDTSGVVVLNGRQLRLRTSADGNHVLEHRSAFGGVSLDGPALYGFSGGVLGSMDGGESPALRWDHGTVDFRGGLQVQGESMFVVCEHTETASRGGGTQTITFSNAECGGTAPFGTQYVGFLSKMDVCAGAVTTEVFPGVQGSTFPGVKWFPPGSGCSNGTYTVRAVYLRKP